MAAHRTCTICRQQPQMDTGVRCEDCQRVFNALRQVDKALLTTDKRRVPDANRLRAAVLGGAYVAPPPKLKSAGHKRPQRSSAPQPKEVQEALGVLRDFRAQRQGVQGFVYCVGERIGHNLSPYVKIGYSVNPDKRLIELQTSNPRTLVLLGTIAGTVDDEAALHAKYHKFNVMQEWFGRAPGLMAEFGLTHDGRKATS